MSDKKEVQLWADRAMYTAVPTNVSDTAPVVPTVSMLASQNDPLGAVAASSLMYIGQPITDLRDVSDADRVKFFEDIKRTRLESPFEFIDFHFILEGVTRAFTHQMVRQRTAVYVQESQRFAVKENGEHEVSMPPSLNGTISLDELVAKEHAYMLSLGLTPPHEGNLAQVARERANGAQRQRLAWDDVVAQVSRGYMELVNGGMPAEDARGLLPTNITTRIHYKTNLRALIGHAGNRLCTQAQFEWRIVWAGMVKAIRDYGKTATYEQWLYQDQFDELVHSDEEFKVIADELTTAAPEHRNPRVLVRRSSAWQFDLLSQMFAPICYSTGKCEFMSNMDRHCNIRERVQQYAANGVKSNEWSDGRADLGIPAIRAEEWLADPASARLKAEA